MLKQKLKKLLAVSLSLPLIVTGTYIIAKADDKDASNKSVTCQQVNNFMKTYENSNDDTSEISVVLDLDGGTYNNETEKSYRGHTGDTFIISKPEKKGYIFKGWQLTAGDCSIIYKNYTYTVTFGNKSSILKAVWESDGTVVETPVPSETPAPTETLSITTEPTQQPNIKNIDVYIDLNGCEYKGTTVLEKVIPENTTTILFDSVYLLQREGYKVDSFTCEYGECTVNQDGKVVYSSPYYTNTMIDKITVNWVESSNLAEDNKNIVNVDLNGGIFIETGKETDTIITNINENSILFSLSDIKRDGYKIKSFECTPSENNTIYVQDGKVVLSNKAYIQGGITLKAVWEADCIPIPSSTEKPTVTEPARKGSNTIIVPIATSVVKQTEKPGVSGEEETKTSTTVKLTVSRNTITMGVDERVKISAKATQNAKITFVSKDTHVCDVTSTGTIVGRKLGKTQIVVRAGGITKKINVQVFLKPDKVWLTNNFKTKVTYTVKKGKTKQLPIYFNKNSYSNKLTFISSNKKIATVSSKGKVKAKKKGKCKITVKTYNGKKAVATIKVK